MVAFEILVGYRSRTIHRLHRLILQNLCNLWILTSGHREDDFAEGLVGLEATMGLLDLIEWEDGVDYWLNSSPPK